LSDLRRPRPGVGGTRRAAGPHGRRQGSRHVPASAGAAGRRARPGRGGWSCVLCWSRRGADPVGVSRVGD